MRPPEFTDDALLAAWRAGALPLRFVAMVSSRALWPSVTQGTRLVMTRAAPWPGAVACVASGARVAWRRVVAVRGGEALLRAEVAPFDDGWWGDLLGCAEAPSGPWNALAARAPAMSTGVAWAGAMAWARARGAAAHMREGEAAFTTRLLGADDAAARSAMLARAYGGRLTGAAPAAVVGLFAPERTLVGEYHLLTDGDRGLSSAMVVEPAWRGRGGGVVLARVVLAAARSFGLRTVGCAIAARNTPSVRAHLRAGYRDTGRWRRWPEDPLLAAERQWREFEAVL